MKKIISLLLILSSMRLVAQSIELTQIKYMEKKYWKYEPVDKDNNTPFKFYYQYDSLGEYLGWVREFPRNGDWINFYKEDSTKVASIFYVENSLINGKSTQFYLNGNKQSEYEFYNNEQNGFTRYWNQKGILVSEDRYEYKDDEDFKSSIRVGEWREWDDEGHLVKFNNFFDNEFHGRQLEFYPDGQIKGEEFYINGKKDSTITEFHPNGQIAKQGKYRKGEFIENNPSIEFHPNGKISGKGDIEDELKTGTWTYYYENGEKESEGKYEKYSYNHNHGNQLFYHKQGLWKYWYSNGNMKAVGKYDKKKIGDTDFSGNSPRAIGVREGDWKYFDEKGNEISIKEFGIRSAEIQD